MEVLDLFEKITLTDSFDIQHTNFDLVVGGGGFRCYYHLGFFKLIKKMNYNPRYFIGTSSGAISIVYYTCGLTDAQIFKTYEIIQKLMNSSLGLCLHDAAVQALQTILPPNAHELCSGKIKILVSELRWFGFVKKYIDKFETFDDLINAISASINIPWLTSSNIYGTIINGSRCYDGCFTSVVPIFCPQTHDLNQLVLLTHKVVYPKKLTLYPGDSHIYLLALKGLIEAKDFFTKKSEHHIIKWIDKSRYKPKSKSKNKLVIIPSLMFVYSLLFIQFK